MRFYRYWISFGVTLFLSSSLLAATEQVQVGSKKFTESVVLGDIIQQLIESKGIQVLHRAEIGGTKILFNALTHGDIDVYPEYTGTISIEILRKKGKVSHESIRAALQSYGIEMTNSLGFNNTYAIGMKKETAHRLKIRTISDLRMHPELKLGLSSEFRQRADGWPNVKRRYQLPQKNIRGLDHDVAYRALQNGEIDVIDLYSTDAEIQYYNLLVLDDSLSIFPKYEAVFLYRSDLQSRFPHAVEVIQSMIGKINPSEMTDLNLQAKIQHIPESRVAQNFIRSHFGFLSHVKTDGLMNRVSQRLNEHLNLVSKSLFAAILVAVPLGIVSARYARVGQLVLACLGIIQTVPALALLVMLIHPLKSIGLSGIGDTPAILALFLYSLLPIVRNTHSGLMSLSIQIRESAEALGLSEFAKLRLIELPLASPMILAGIKTAAVINVGFATLGALIGAGGFGQPILTGIRLDDNHLILEGAIPSALLAISVQFLFDFLENFLVPRGIRKSYPTA
jgi:osmoprotectant transport system permease protein